MSSELIQDIYLLVNVSSCFVITRLCVFWVCARLFVLLYRVSRNDTAKPQCWQAFALLYYVQRKIMWFLLGTSHYGCILFVTLVACIGVLKIVALEIWCMRMFGIFSQMNRMTSCCTVLPSSTLLCRQLAPSAVLSSTAYTWSNISDEIPTLLISLPSFSHLPFASVSPKAG